MSKKTATATPGPWRIDRDVNGRAAEGAAYALNLIIETDERHIAFVFDEHKADASLISAAPEMLAALQLAYDFITIPVPEFRKKYRDVKAGIGESTVYVTSQIAAAIAKAEGKQE